MGGRFLKKNNFGLPIRPLKNTMAESMGVTGTFYVQCLYFVIGTACGSAFVVSANHEPY
jgi:hypothetical protein